MKLCHKIIVLVLAVLAFSCAENKNVERIWLKGNTHTHTTLSDGDAPPEYVVKWYHDRGYHFFSLNRSQQVR